MTLPQASKQAMQAHEIHGFLHAHQKHVFISGPLGSDHLLCSPKMFATPGLLINQPPILLLETLTHRINAILHQRCSPPGTHFISTAATSLWRSESSLHAHTHHTLPPSLPFRGQSIKK